ncbi:MAG: ABC-F family ATP-binding cassette domain-containing protein [Tatlockia sp.]|nr:ABC-F family ATP-binding cassette domain-containing protein [Tatlockia sp.]
MMHKPVQFRNLSLSFPHKTCFEAFNGQISYGERIAIIGRNGAGKSTLLQILQGRIEPSDGEISLPDEIRIGYLPQVIHDFPELSGGQRLNKALTEILTTSPDFLLLDEPTNHLDSRNRRSFMRMLKSYQGTLVIVSHDLELLSSMIATIWHIEHEQVDVFCGHYSDYQRELAQKKITIEQELTRLSLQKKEAHLSLMREQKRNKNCRLKGEKQIEQRKWPTIRSNTKMANSVKTGDKRSSQINVKKQQLLDQLARINQPEVINPKFNLRANEHQKALIVIRDAAVSYGNQAAILSDLDFQVKARERVVLFGENGSGKSTLVRAILGEPELTRTGEWLTPNKTDIGYLDQHYNNLSMNKTVLDTISAAMPQASYLELRKHLNDFLFRKNEEVHAEIASLSGGEKARLSLALIAANPPKLLILDEITNNLDLETRTHVIDLLLVFPGAMIVISHDRDFLKSIQIETIYQLRQGRLGSLIDEDREVFTNE